MLSLPYVNCKNYSGFGYLWPGKQCFLWHFIVTLTVDCDETGPLLPVSLHSLALHTYQTQRWTSQTDLLKKITRKHRRFHMNEAPTIGVCETLKPPVTMRANFSMKIKIGAYLLKGFISELCIPNIKYLSFNYLLYAKALLYKPLSLIWL